MKKLIFTQILIIVSTLTAIAQTSDERDLLKFISDCDEAYMNNEIAFVERNLAEDYILVVDGERKKRTRESNATQPSGFAATDAGKSSPTILRMSKSKEQRCCRRTRNERI